VQAGTTDPLRTVTIQAHAVTPLTLTLTPHENCSHTARGSATAAAPCRRTRALPRPLHNRRSTVSMHPLTGSPAMRPPQRRVDAPAHCLAHRAAFPVFWPLHVRQQHQVSVCLEVVQHGHCALVTRLHPLAKGVSSQQGCRNWCRGNGVEAAGIKTAGIETGLMRRG
jgi:hypothetical protein